MSAHNLYFSKKSATTCRLRIVILLLKKLQYSIGMFLKDPFFPDYLAMPCICYEEIMLFSLAC